MAEYINRTELIENLKKQYGEDLGWQCTVNMSDIGMMIEDAPTADVVEVRHGEWIYPSYAPYGGSYMMRHCSLCDYRPPYVEGIIYEPYTRYCPNCGADMRGDKSDV